MRKYHVCILAPVHSWEYIRIFHKEAVSLAEKNYRVTLFARGSKNLNVQNVQIKALSAPRNRINRFLNIPRIFLRALKERADVYHLHNPDTLPLGFGLKMMGKKVVYDVHEDFTRRVLQRRWIPKVFRPALSFLIFAGERLAGILFDLVIITQPEIQSRIGKKAAVIENAPIAESKLIDKAYALSRSIPEEKFFRVIYAGRVGKSRGLREMVKAVGILNKKIKARMWLIGEANSRDLKEAEHDTAWNHIDYLGALSQEKTFAYMIKSRAGLAVIQDTADHRYSSANKIYEYMRFSLPFVASSFKKWKDQLASETAGIFVDPSRPEAIAEALSWIAAQPREAEKMGEKGREFIMKKFNWETESRKLFKLYSRILK